jgi:AcrR family transcriptional regulator
MKKSFASDTRGRLAGLGLDENVSTGSTHKSGGRPRNPRIDHAVAESALRILDTVGYGNLTVDAVARLAGTSRTAVYRRWATKTELVLYALSSSLGQVAAPNTGCTLCDIDECLRLYLAAFRQIRPDVFGALLADCASDAGLRAGFMTALFDPPRDAVKTALARASTTGDLLPDVDQGLVADMLGAFIHYRTLFGHAGTSDEEIDSAVRTLLQGIAGDYPRLLAHSKATEASHPRHRH